MCVCVLCVCVCVYVCVCVCACVRHPHMLQEAWCVCVCACVRACVRHPQRSHTGILITLWVISPAFMGTWPLMKTRLPVCTHGT